MTNLGWLLKLTGFRVLYYVKTPVLIYEPSNHNALFSTNIYPYKQERTITSYRHNTFPKKLTRKLKFVNWNHEAVSYTDRFFAFYHGFGYGDICGWTTYHDDFFRRTRNVSYPTE